jgi:hypothetical protein
MSITVRLYAFFQPDVFVVCPCTRASIRLVGAENQGTPSVLTLFLSPIRSARMIDSIQSQVIGILGIMIVDKSVIVSDSREVWHRIDRLLSLQVFVFGLGVLEKT